MSLTEDQLMPRPHHPTPEAIELTEGEKDKIMNDFLLPTAYLSTKTANELLIYQMALAVAFENCKGNDITCAALKELYVMVEQARADLIWEGQQLPWKD